MNDFVRPLTAPTTAGAVATPIAYALVVGNPDRPVRAIGALSVGGADALAFCDDPAGAALPGTPAAVILVPTGVRVTPREDQTFIMVDDVRAAFIDTVASLLPGAERPEDPSAGIDPGALVHETARVSPLAAVAAGVIIGPRTRVGPGAVVYADTHIGADCVIGPGTAIGFVGLAYHDARDGRRRFFPHLAGVRIGDRVDVGAQACICRGMLSHTRVGDDVKIGSLVYVSHGVSVESRAWLSAGTAIAGHATIAADGVLGIGSVVVDNVALEAGVRVGGGSVVTKDAAAGQSLYGVPAHPVPVMAHFGPTPRE
jgi:UDP-3-O-[3-hydroxymyristoyl] glucosamine N-acyltransferase